MSGMRITYWPDRARSNIAPLWPWLVPASPESSTMVREALFPYWEKRLEAVPASVLSGQFRDRLRLARPSITAETLGAAGYDRVLRAARGDAETWWFFDLGASAWQLLIAELIDDEVLLVGPSVRSALEAVWQAGPDAAIEWLEAACSVEEPEPLYMLARGIHALWHERQASVAHRWFELAVASLPPRILRAFGQALPLTYAMVMALSGKLARAISLLEPDNDRRSQDWLGTDSAESSYHLARYKWDAGDQDGALTALGRAIDLEPDYALRMMSEPVWLDVSTQSPPIAALHLTASRVQQAREEMVRWQQVRSEAVNSLPATRQLLDLLKFAGDDPYVLLVAQGRIHAVKEQVEAKGRVTPGLQAMISRLEEFARELPGSLSLKAGPGFAPRFRDGPKNEMGILRSLLERGAYRPAEQRVLALNEALPRAVQGALMHHLRRLVRALATAGDVLVDRGRDEDRARYMLIVSLLERSMEVLPRIKGLPDRVDAALGREADGIWTELGNVEKAWVDSEKRYLGALQLLPPEPMPEFLPGDVKALACRVIDSSGAPAAGVPVTWELDANLGTAQGASPHLDGEWSTSLATGIVYLAFTASTARGSAGKVNARILGDHSPITIPITLAGPQR